MLADGLQVRVRDGGDRDHWQCYRWLDRELAAYRPTVIWTSLSRSSVIGLLLGRRRAIPVACWQHNAFLERGTQIERASCRERGWQSVEIPGVARSLKKK